MDIPLGLLMLASLSFGIWYATFYGKPNRKKALGIALGIAVFAAPMVMKKVDYGKLRAPVFGYSIVLGIVLACAIGCAVEAVPGWQAVLAAALLFSFSDFVLMLMTFSKGSLFGNVINLITYYAAQLLFAGSVLLCR